MSLEESFKSLFFRVISTFLPGIYFYKFICIKFWVVVVFGGVFGGFFQCVLVRKEKQTLAQPCLSCSEFPSNGIWIERDFTSVKVFDSDRPMWFWTETGHREQWEGSGRRPEMEKIPPANPACSWELQLGVESLIPGKENLKAPNTQEPFQSFMYIQETFTENLILTKYCAKQ